MSIPTVPICRNPADDGPCRFAGSCDETRQRGSAGQILSLGQFVERFPPLRGRACWAYDIKLDRESVASLGVVRKSDAALEREAIASEGAPF